MDEEEKRWAIAGVKAKNIEDAAEMDNIFYQHHAPLIDATVRAHFKDLCGACIQDANGDTITDFHICTGKTSDFVTVFGGKLLDIAEKESREKVWIAFCDQIYSSGIFRRAVLKWLESFYSAKNHISNNKEILFEYMQLHFPDELRDE